MCENRTTYWILLTLGCSSGDRARFGPGAVDTAYEAEQDPDLDDTGLDEAPVEVASWWRLQADLFLESGDVKVDGTVLRAEVLSADGTMICAMSAVMDGGEVDTLRELPHESIQHWWSVRFTAWDDGCLNQVDISDMPTEFLLGMGQMHPEILAVIDTVVAADSGASDTLHAAYASFDSEESLLVFGVAGTESDFDGLVEEDVPENPTGTYFVHPLYSFVFPVDG